ncbi:MAG: hypothetical protein ACOCXJ_05175 [Planctomycetota bacterium]
MVDRLHIPIRLRLPSRGADWSAVQEGVGRAVARALERADRSLARHRPGTLRRRPRAAVYRFADGAGDEDWQDRLRVAVDAGIAAALARADRSRGGGDQQRVGALDGATPGEAYDPQRHDTERGTYRLPFYDDPDGAVGTVAVPADPETRLAAVQRAIAIYPTLTAARDQARQHAEAQGGRPGYLGTIRTSAQDIATGLFVFDHPRAGSYTGYTWYLSRVDLERQAHEGRSVQRLQGQDGTGSLVAVPGAAEAALIAYYTGLVAGNEPPVPEAAIRRFAREQARRGLRVFQMSAYNHSFPIISDLEIPVPIHFLSGPAVDHSAAGESGGSGTGSDSAAADGAGSGTDGGSGDGGGSGGRPRAGGLGGGAQTGGRMWPTRGANGEALRCAPYLGEPHLDQLVEGGDRLRARMQEVQRALEIPKLCDWPGQYTINCASLIGGYAHSIGLVATDDPTPAKATVRPDGSGNHGVVDIQFTLTPHLRMLQHLAGIGPDVYSLGQRVYSVYTMPANRPLVCIDEDREHPDAVAWGIRFLNAFPTRLEASYAVLYAETCRVLLLQQLRASARFIAERRENIDATEQAFAAALGVMGDAILRMQVLKRAIAFARFPYVHQQDAGRVGHHGGGTHLVQTERLRRGDFLGEAIVRRGAGLDAAIFEPLDGARVVQEGGNWVVQWEGRSWDEDGLDQAIAFRRSLLNTVDPLFLQVEDLERLHRRFRRDPVSLRGYLTGLLAEMAQANAGITRKTQEADDGALFAVSTSKYVETELAHDSRGLRFQMHGIHKQADDALRLRAGNLSSYIAGVNRAIGHEKAFDDLLMFGSTAGIILLAVVCAPLGAVAAGAITGVAGLGFAAYDLHRASEREDVYRSLENPEEILAWHEVELEYLFAYLGAAFSVFDVVGVGRGVRAGLGVAKQAMRTALREGAQEAGERVVRESIEHISRQLARGVMQEAIRGAVGAAAVMGAMQLALPHLIGPAIRDHVAAIRAGHGSVLDDESLDSGSAQDAEAARLHQGLTDDAAAAGPQRSTLRRIDPEAGR